MYDRKDRLPMDRAIKTLCITRDGNTDEQITRVSTIYGVKYMTLKREVNRILSK